MHIHVVKRGDTLSSIAAMHDALPAFVAADNGLALSTPLVIGQALVVRTPKTLHTVRAGETLSSIARDYDLSVRTLLRQNFFLHGRELLREGDTRNVIDRYRYWTMEAIVADLDTQRHPFHVAIENWQHDMNIGSIVRSANAFAADTVHIVGRRGPHQIAMTPKELVRVGSDTESQVLARAVRRHVEHRILLNGHRTVVFR